MDNDIIQLPRKVNAPAGYEPPERDQPVKEADMSDSNIPFGCCHCGCGRKTKFAPQNHATRGWIKGQPLHFIRGHGGHKWQKGVVHKRRMSIITALELSYFIDQRTECWIWRHATNRKNGYGRVVVNGRLVMAHRYLYEQRYGPIPVGLDLHHLCENKLCVNPDHMAPLTRRSHMKQHFSKGGKLHGNT